MENNYNTYQTGRKCKHCGNRIADQAHGLIEFCDRKILEDGSIKSCKDDYNSALRREEEKPYRNLVAFHKQMSLAIGSLYLASGANVLVEQLNQYGIQLNKAIELERKEGLYTFYFLHHKICQLSKSKYKITPHVYSF